MECSAKYVNENCECLTDPLDVYSTICGYINKSNGLVYPCETGCCITPCKNVGIQPPLNQDFRPSGGGILPPGFNVNLPHSDEPTINKTEAPFYQVKQSDDKTWQMILALFLILIMVIFALLFLFT